MRAADRISGIGTSIFTEISRLAVEHGAVNLGQGFPDFEAPDFVKDAAVRAIAANHNQYAPAQGLPRLRREIARIWNRRWQWELDADAEVTVTSGATEALFCATLAVANPGDEVVVFEPFYDAYLPAIQMAGAVPRVVQLRPPGWTFDAAALAAAFTPRTRMVVVNTPHNPTGKVWSTAELDTLAHLCCQHDVVALADEVYSEITFPGAHHLSIATRPGMRARTITVDSLGKTFSVTGWKIGWAVASDALTRALRAVHQFVTFCTASPLQEAAADALAQAATSTYYADLRGAYQARRDRLARALASAGLATLPIAGAYFLLADIAAQPFADDAAFCRHLITQVGVAAIPPSAFYRDPAQAPKLARFCFAKRDATIDLAAERLRALR